MIGVLKSKGGDGFGGPDLDSFAYIPYKTSYSFNPDKKFIAINIKVDRQENISLTKEQIKKSMLGRYSEDNFSVIEATEILNAVSSIFAIMNAVLIAIAAISLIVGGVGIMNIMYVSGWRIYGASDFLSGGFIGPEVLPRLHQPPVNSDSTWSFILNRNCLWRLPRTQSRFSFPDRCHQI